MERVCSNCSNKLKRAKFFFHGSTSVKVEPVFGSSKMTNMMGFICTECGKVEFFIEDVDIFKD